MRRPLALPCALVFAAAACVPSTPPGPTVPATASLVCVHQPPRAPSPGKPPLLVLLHGIGTDEHDLAPLAAHLDPRFAVVSVRAPHSQGPGRNAWFDLQLGPGGATTFDAAQAENSRLRLLGFIDEAVAAMNADPRRVYLAGFSQGGIMALAVGLTSPGKVAGVVAMSSRLLPQTKAMLAPVDQLRGLPVLVVHGTQDPVLPVADGRASRDFLATLPVILTYREFPMGHTITAESLATVDGWLRERLAETR